MQEDQTDWPEIAQEICLAVNTSKCVTRGDTPQYLMMGWDAKVTFDVTLTSSLCSDNCKKPAEWRNMIAKQHTWSIQAVYKKQAIAKQKRAHKANLEAASNEESSKLTEGRQVWLYVNLAHPDKCKKLTHQWIGPYRILEKKNIMVKLDTKTERPKMHPWVHCSRVKLYYDTPFPPQNLPPSNIMDEALMLDDLEQPLPEDVYEVEAILDVRTRTIKTGRQKSRTHLKEYLVKWKGYDDEENSWVPESELSCGNLLYEYHFNNRHQARAKGLLYEDNPTNKEHEQ